MLSEEEKKEYEELKSLLYTGTISQYGKRKLIDIIEKQQKEIEEYKKQLDLDNECEIVLNSKVMDLEKEIEELKDTRSIFNMGRRSYKNEIESKIKAKTIEIKNRQVKDEFITASQGKLNTIIDMQSLLEKE
jgi:hypothetical protein